MDKLIGLENVVSVLEVEQEDTEDKFEKSRPYKKQLRKTARLLREEKAAPDLSNHILAIGWK